MCVVFIDWIHLLYRYFIRLLPILSFPWCRCGVINTAWHSALKLTWQVFMFSYVSSVIYSDCTAVYGPTASFHSVSLNQRFAIFLGRPLNFHISRNSYLRKRNKEAVGSALRLLKYCQLFWRYFEVYLGFFCDMSEVLFIYSTISRATHNYVQRNPYWGTMF